MNFQDKKKRHSIPETAILRQKEDKCKGKNDQSHWKKTERKDISTNDNSNN